LHKIQVCCKIWANNLNALKAVKEKSKLGYFPQRGGSQGAASSPGRNQTEVRSGASGWNPWKGK